MNPSPSQTIWINGRKISLQGIVNSEVAPLSEFENSTFDFIRAWLDGQETFVLQTSGSTGIPKSIQVTRAMMVASANATAKALDLRENDHALVCLDTKFIAGKMMIVRCLETGMRIFAVDPNANPLTSLPNDQTIQFTALVPYQVKAILASNQKHLLNNIRTCIIGGAPVDETLRDELRGISCKMFATYGMTETVSHIALKNLNGDPETEFYHTLPGITVKLDSRNCLVITAPYLNGDVVTNDIAELKNNTAFRWIGRYDRVINSGGIKIQAELLEEKIGQILSQMDIPNAFFVHGFPDERFGESVGLVIEGSLNHSTMERLQQNFIHSFSSYEIPKQIFLTPSFSYTKTSKVDRLNTVRMLPANGSKST